VKFETRKVLISLNSEIFGFTKFLFISKQQVS